MSRPSHSRTVSSSSRLSFILDCDGIPHFQDAPSPGPAVEALQTADSTVAGGSSGGVVSSGGLDKAAAEKLIRGAEEEQEKVTLQLLHKFDALNREKEGMTKALEDQSDQVVYQLMGVKRGNERDLFVGPILPCLDVKGAAVGGPSKHSHSSPQRTTAPIPLRINSSDDRYHNRSMGAILTGTSPRPSHSRGSSLSRPSNISPTSGADNGGHFIFSKAANISSPRTPRVPADSIVPSSGPAKSLLLTDYLVHSLEEAHAVEDHLQSLEIWSTELHHLADKFRTEVVELRERLGIASQDIASLPERPTSKFCRRPRSRTVTLSSSSRLHESQTPTTSTPIHDALSPLHSAALLNRRGSRSSTEAPLSMSRNVSGSRLAGVDARADSSADEEGTAASSLASSL